MTNWNWIKFDAGFCWVFNKFYPKRPVGFYGYFLDITQLSEPWVWYKVLSIASSFAKWKLMQVCRMQNHLTIGHLIWASSVHWYLLLVHHLSKRCLSVYIEYCICSVLESGAVTASFPILAILGCYYFWYLPSGHFSPIYSVRPGPPRVGFGAHVCYHCRISPPRFLAECCKRRLNQGSFILLFFRLFTLSDLYLVFACLFPVLYIYLVYFVYFPVLLCLSVSVKWLAVKTASEMTYCVSGGALTLLTHSFT